jgi:hypothetical protein
MWLTDARGVRDQVAEPVCQGRQPMTETTDDLARALFNDVTMSGHITL